MSNKDITPSLDGVMKQNIMKEDFGWEVPIESIPLPSRGVIYSPDSLLFNKQTLNIKSMTAREEDILASPAFHKEGTSLSHLIQSCLTEKGIDSEEMIIGDRTALMIGIRVTGYGSDYYVSAVCQNCEHKNNINVDLTSIPIKRLAISPLQPGMNRFEYVLPVTKKKIHFKYNTAKEERERKIASDALQKLTGSPVSNTITSYLENSIVSIDGITDRAKIKHFVLNMPAYDSKSLRNFISDNEPGMDMRTTFKCSNSKCNSENEIALPITSEFFWPTK